jgi:hypothetical protein
MVKKEINQLKRGRILGKAREQRRVSAVGEVTDSASVLTDSIAKNHPRHAHEDYVSSPNLSIEKTTTVDTINEVSIPFGVNASHDSAVEQKNNYHHSRNNSSDRRRSTQHKEPGPKEEFDDDMNYSPGASLGRKSGHSIGRDDSHNRNRIAQSPNKSYDCCEKEADCREGSYAQENPSCASQNSNPAKCSQSFYGDDKIFNRQSPKESKCGIKCLWSKVLTFLGLKTTASDRHIKTMDSHSKGCSLNQTKEVNRRPNSQSNRRNRNR